MKTILAFGDSLTWGFRAGEWMRHDYADRWPNALQMGLGGKARVIEEGHNGRTTVFDDPTTFDDRNGAKALPILLATHQPLDLVIIMLGTNDIKFANRCRAFDASLGMMRLVEIVQKFSLPARLPDAAGPDHVAAAAGADQGRMVQRPVGPCDRRVRSSSRSTMPMWPRPRAWAFSMPVRLRQPIRPTAAIWMRPIRGPSARRSSRWSSRS